MLEAGHVGALSAFRRDGHSLLRPAYGFHGLITVVANCYLAAGLMFLAYMGWRAYQAVNAQRRRVPFVELSREAG